MIHEAVLDTSSKLLQQLLLSIYFPPADTHPFPRTHTASQLPRDDATIEALQQRTKMSPLTPVHLPWRKRRRQGTLLHVSHRSMQHLSFYLQVFHHSCPLVENTIRVHVTEAAEES